jgi:hypothetical protein
MFSGMFNCVSQVAYFHNANYKTPQQERCDVTKVSTGMVAGLHVIPPIMQMYPDIEILFEESHIDLLNASKTFAFVIMAQKVYLLTPHKHIYYHANITVLLEMYLQLK